MENPFYQPFQRCGLAALSDLNSLVHKDLFSKLEKEQGIFLKKESEFRSNEYKWPRNPLYDFSRVWEYPYVYYHLADYFKKCPKKSRPVVADIGSGVTFFPFSIARLGYQVICTDIDPICKKDLSLANNCVPHSPGRIDFRLIKDSFLPLNNSECDSVYCISVLEHIPDFEKTIAEMARILKPDGLCLLTCDINMKPEDNLQLDCENYKLLLSSIAHHFVRVFPEITIHPLDMLTTINSPYPRTGTSLGIAQILWRLLKQKVLKPLLGRKQGNINIGPPYVTVLGLVLRKK